MSDRVSVDPRGFLKIDGAKMPVKVKPNGNLEFCDKSAAQRHLPTRFKEISLSELTAGVRKATGTSTPVRVQTA
jgi:hypothetical protein